MEMEVALAKKEIQWKVEMEIGSKPYAIFLIATMHREIPEIVVVDILASIMATH